ncbi:hypothetical protein AB0H58_12755, partial [Nocardia neocaledoniensis]|uniref:hypothetical protein n=1 Tax=Nocardia neocaledoniensis TaxID=236511 RepID=UPI00340D7BBD
MSDDVLGLEERTERADRESARGTSTADEHERRARAAESGGRTRADEPRRPAERGEPAGRPREQRSDKLAPEVSVTGSNVTIFLSARSKQ